MTRLMQWERECLGILGIVFFVQCLSPLILLFRDPICNVSAGETLNTNYDEYFCVGNGYVRDPDYIRNESKNLTVLIAFNIMLFTLQLITLIMWVIRKRYCSSYDKPTRTEPYSVIVSTEITDGNEIEMV